MALTLILSRLGSPIGGLQIVADGEDRVRGVSFGAGVTRAMAREYPGARLIDGDAPEAVVEGLSAYFEGDRNALERIPWSLEGAAAGDGFQARVWRALAAVPVGTTLSYGEMARRAGQPGTAQAAGVALNRNPIALVLACHRVIGAADSSGHRAMVGFGGGLERKTWLLRHEGAILI